MLKSNLVNGSNWRIFDRLPLLFLIGYIFIFTGCGRFSVPTPTPKATPTFPSVNSIKERPTPTADSAKKIAEPNESNIVTDMNNAKVAYLIPQDPTLLEPEAVPHTLFDDPRYKENGLSIFVTDSWDMIRPAVNNGELQALIIHHAAVEQIDDGELADYLATCRPLAGVGNDKFIIGNQPDYHQQPDDETLFFNVKVSRRSSDSRSSGRSMIPITKEQKSLIFPSLWQHITQGDPDDPCKSAPDPTPNAEQAQQRDKQFLQLAIEEVLKGNQTFIAEEIFFHGTYGVTTYESSGYQTFQDLKRIYSGDAYGDKQITIMADVTTPLPNALTFEQAAELNPTNRPVEAIVLSSGWGLDESAEALLYFTKENDLFMWIGAIFSFDDFVRSEPVISIEPAPAVAEFLRVEQTESETRGTLLAGLTINPWHVTINPAGTMAVYAETSEPVSPNSYTIIDLTTGQQTEYPPTDGIQIGTGAAVWLNDSEVLLGFRTERSGEGPYWGHLSKLDTQSGEIMILDDAVPLRQPPFLTADGTIVYAAYRNPKLRILQNGEVRKLKADFDSAPALSTDQRYLIGVGKHDNESNTNSYRLIDLQTGESDVLLTFSPPGMGGYFPPATWNGSSTWAAIQPWSFAAEEQGVTLIEARTQRTIFLGIGTSNPRWVDGTTLLFNALVDGDQQLHIFDISTGERYHVLQND